MPWKRYEDLDIPISEKPKVKKRYSVTGDILQFQLCKRQYGFFNVKNFQPSQLTQYWYGTLMHQVLDKLHFHYQGLIDPTTEGLIPSEEDIELYFNQVSESLRLHGIKAIDSNTRKVALKVLKIFNKIEGPNLYPKVIDTELTFQNDQEEYLLNNQDGYILEGKVDVLKDASVGKDIKGYDLVEIWDYKGSKFPDINREDGKRRLKRYTLQMLAYANLYKQKEGNYPLKGILYFMNELYTDPEPIETPTQAIYEIDFRNPMNLDQISIAMESFSKTIIDIEECKESDSWNEPEFYDKETCDICDKRWDCPLVEDKYPMRYP